MNVLMITVLFMQRMHANALPSASDLAAAQAALLAAAGEHVELPRLNPYQVAALPAPTSPRAELPSQNTTAASKIKSSGRGSIGHDHKGGVKKPRGKHVSPEKRAKLTGTTTTQPLLHPVAPLHPAGLAEPPVFGGGVPPGSRDRNRDWI